MSVVEQLARKIRPEMVVLFLGGTDVGKTTLIRNLHELLGGKVVDGDVGQSWIGPPSVVSMGTPQKMEAGYFVGDISPRGNLLQVMTGIALMAMRAERPCLIDTDGYLGESAARAYKTELINLVRPDLLVLMQREHELDYYKLFVRKGIEVIDLAVAHRGIKTREERIRAREQAFRSYFQGAKQRRWPLSEIKFERGLLGCGRSIETETLSKMLGCTVRAAWQGEDELVLVVEGYAYSLGTLRISLGVRRIHIYGWHDLENLLLGCVCDGEFLGLGLLKGLTSQDVEVWTPVERASVLQLGALRLDEKGRHERVRLSL